MENEKKEKTARVKLRYYRGDEFVPSKEVLCEIKMDVVKTFVLQTDEARGVGTFLRTIDGEDAEALLDYAKKNNGVVKIGVKYCAACQNEYDRYVKTIRETGPLQRRSSTAWYTAQELPEKRERETSLFSFVLILTI